MLVSRRGLIALMILNVLAAGGVYVLAGLQYGMARSVMWSRYRDLEHHRVIVVNEEAMRAHYLPEISQQNPQTVVPRFIMQGYSGSKDVAWVAVAVFVINAIVLCVWLLRAPAGSGDRCAQSCADEQFASSREDSHRGPLAP